MSNVARTVPNTDGGGVGESRVIITSPEAADMQKAVNDHFARSMECAVSALASGGGSRQWPGRNLPEAFFSKPPPSAKSKTSSNTPLAHSRDGSTDSSGRYTLSPPATASLSPLVQHSRTHSSPAIIGNVAQPQHQANFSQQLTNPSTVIHHQKHRSFDNTLESDPSMQHLWQQAQYGGGGGYLQQQPLCGEKTSKSLGDLATSEMGMDSGFVVGGQMDVGYGEPHNQQHMRKISCNDAPMMWNEFSAGQPVQKPAQQQFMRQQTRQTSSIPSGGARTQILKRRQEQQQQQQQQQFQHQQHCQLQQMPPTNMAFTNPVVQELNQERQRMYERNLQLRQQGLLDPLPAAHLSSVNQLQSDLPPGQYQTPNAPTPYQNSQQQQYPAQMFHTRQGSSDSGLEMQMGGGGYPTYASYVRTPAEMDLNFANISLDPSTLMEMDPSVLPTGPLDIAPDDLDQYLNH